MTGRFSYDGEFCAVGQVLDEIDPNGWKEKRYPGVFARPHRSHRALEKRYGKSFLDRIAYMNDMTGRSFSYIADYIERYAKR